MEDHARKHRGKHPNRGRIKGVADHLDGTFCLTYGDGVSNVNVTTLIDHHRSQGCEATVTAIQTAGRFGGLVMDGGMVSKFQEKPKCDCRWINGGFLCEPAVLDRISNDQTVFEKEPLEALASEGELSVWKHDGCWQSIDTLRDRNLLEDLWSRNEAPWKTWE